MSHTGFTWDSDSNAAPASKGNGFSWDTDPNKSALDLEDAKARNAQPTKFEQENTPQGSAWQRLGSGAWAGLKALNPFQGITTGTPQDMRRETLDPWKAIGPIGSMAESAYGGYKEARNAGQGVLPSLASAAGAPLGLDTAGIRERAAKGDVAGVIGEALPSIGGVLVGEGIHRMPEIRAAARDVLTTPEGELKPMAHAASRMAGGTVGGAVGSLVGHPEMGAYVGYREGPSVVRSILGKRPAPEPFKPMGPETPTSIPPIGAQSAPVTPKPGPTIEVTGRWSEPTPIPEAQRSGPSILANDQGTIIRKPFGLLPETAGAEPISYRVDSNGVRYARVPSLNAEVSVPDNLEGADAEAYARNKLDLQKQFMQERNPITRLGSQIEEASGWKPLEPNVPLRNQSFGGQITWRRPAVGENVIGGETPILKAPEKLSTIATEEPMRQMGASPLRPGVALKDQPAFSEAPVRSEQSRLEEKYPDKAQRQLVHANGEEMMDAIGNDTETAKAIHDLTNTDVRQALINSGEDMGQRSIGNRKAMGGSQMTRQEAFTNLLRKGYSPQQIVALAHRPM